MVDVSVRIREAPARRARTDFLPPDMHRGAGEDRPLPIGHGQTNSQPTMLRIVRTGPDAAGLEATRHGPFRFVPLIED